MLLAAPGTDESPALRRSVYPWPPIPAFCPPASGAPPGSGPWPTDVHPAPMPHRLLIPGPEPGRRPLPPSATARPLRPLPGPPHHLGQHHGGVDHQGEGGVTQGLTWPWPPPEPPPPKYQPPAYAQHPTVPPHGTAATSPGPPCSSLAWMRGVLLPHSREHGKGKGLRHPPHAKCQGRQFFSKNHSVGFCFGEPLAERPPRMGPMARKFRGKIRLVRDPQPRPWGLLSPAGLWSFLSRK